MTCGSFHRAARTCNWRWAGRETPPPVPDGRFDILALSSGGPDGAFGAGALKGLAKTANRPDYEIVTGISTGAIMAPFVFTGAHNDAMLERFYTTGEMGKLVGQPNVLAALSGPSLYSDTKIVPFVNKHIDAALMRRVAAEHAKGRRLLIGTANLDTNQFTVWNMGRIAEIGTPEALELFRDVVRASFAIPGALPPVEIASASAKTFRELHGDGGVIAYFYADPMLAPPAYRPAGKKARKTAATPRIDIILHNQIEAKPEAVKPKTLELAGVSVSNLTRSGMRLLLDNTLRDRGRCRHGGAIRLFAVRPAHGVVAGIRHRLYERDLRVRLSARRVRHFVGNRPPPLRIQPIHGIAYSLRMHLRISRAFCIVLTELRYVIIFTFNSCKLRF